MVFRIEIRPNLDVMPHEPRGEALRQRFTAMSALRSMELWDVYTLDGRFATEDVQAFAEVLRNPVTQIAQWRDRALSNTTCDADWVVELGFLPGVTDNVATTARDMWQDMTGKPLGEGEGIYSSRLLFLQGHLQQQDVQQIAETLANPLINRIHILSGVQYQAQGGMALIVPKVKLQAHGIATEVTLPAEAAALEEIGIKGVPNGDGTFRGPLGLSLDYMVAIRDYFQQEEGRNPTDIELEMLAQSWSEHCKHTIFAAGIDDIKEGLFRHYIRRATIEIRDARGKDDFCVSVFKDNSGGILLNDQYVITDKVETHNSPSALDPFGGAITGIVGVNRDTLGYGKGAKPILNRYGFCFADPRKEQTYYRSPDKTRPTLSARYVMEGVIHGVNVGGNCSGIPTPQGFAYFDDRFIGKPLVFVGTVGLIPRMLQGEDSSVKQAKAGDSIVMLGGRVGKDGIHGATFSSVALDEGSPATAVQIGDPITQKKFSDAILREARALNLYHAITDNGAGGLSSSIGEMGRDSNGFEVELDRVPLKYPGMEPWEIWISESQERMTLAIAPDKVEAFLRLMHKRGCEATVIGRFTDSGRAVIHYRGQVIMDMSMDFLHEGLPEKQLQTQKPHIQVQEPVLPPPAQHDTTLLAMLGRLNLCGKAFIANQYDHEVQATSVLKPLQGKGQVYAEASVIRPLLNDWVGAVTSQGLVPRYSDIDTYAMAAASLDMAVRNAIAVGVNPDRMALCDNFCWCDSTNPERLYQLKQAVKACYDVAVAYAAPYISGKDSMFNDFKGYDADGRPVMISAPPTLLASVLGVMPDVRKATSLDAKMAGDIIYIIGETADELGGSEYYALHDQLGANVPQWKQPKALLERYKALYAAQQRELVASAMAVNLGGMGVALAKTLIGGMLGAEIDLRAALKTADVQEDATLLYAETLGRFVVTVAPQNAEAFEALMQPHGAVAVGTVTNSGTLRVTGLAGDVLIQQSITSLHRAYHAPLADY